jgi:hypothetical protein
MNFVFLRLSKKICGSKAAVWYPTPIWKIFYILSSDKIFYSLEKFFSWFPFRGVKVAISCKFDKLKNNISGIWVKGLRARGCQPFCFFFTEGNEGNEGNKEKPFVIFVCFC